MKPKPLKGKEGYVDSWQIRDRKDVHPSHATKVFKSEDVKSACGFYLRYKDKPELLIKEHPEYKKEIEKINNICPYCIEVRGKLSHLIPIGVPHLTCGKELYKCSKCRGIFCLECDATKDKTYYNEWLFKLAFSAVLGGEA